jgi:hypothetical protein
MPRAYSTSTVAHALRADPKWLDNLLAHHNVLGTAKARQGSPRHLTPESIAILYIAKALTSSLGCTVAQALEVATSLVKQRELHLAPGLTLTADPSSIHELLQQRLLDAVQTAPPKTRGRPPNRQARSRRDDSPPVDSS